MAILLQLTCSISAQANINKHPDAENALEYQNNEWILNRDGHTDADIECFYP